MNYFIKTTALALAITTGLLVSPLRADDKIATQELVHGMTSAMGRGDVPVVVESYTADGLLVLGDTEFRGPDMLTAAYQEFAAISPHITFERESIWVSGDTALHIAPWSMTGTGPNNSVITDEGLSVVVMQRQDDGMWKITIDQPHAEANTK
ncbi:YybH family protein [Halocynthiibacter namhaensis]|uniref:YybH family protein n=1 Tax=Halocynthiibacter namhaensis TaxID=1290553 RepID=UPI0005793E97|nr:DUF4440 domain-containing protein [Halocynthiibacter namhaensis]